MRALLLAGLTAGWMLWKGEGLCCPRGWMLLAWLPAVWMLWKRQRLYCPRRCSRLPRRFLPLKIFLMSRFEFDLQTISGFLLCPPWPGTEPLFGSGKNAWRSGWARAVPVRSANAPRSTASSHTLLIRTGTYTMSERLESVAVVTRLGLILLALLLLPASASAAPRVQHLHFKYGPVTIQPGQNTISIAGDKVPRPKVSGWIVGFRPNLRRPGRSVPRVDVIHLHHAVWLINGRPTFAAGEEKTRVKLPRGVGSRYRPGGRGDP